MKDYIFHSPINRIIFVLIFVAILGNNSFAQTSCYETVSLPTDSKWGGSDAVGSVLIGNTYGAGQGPGIYIVADGGYRLYLNGELLAYDNAAGRVRFIPMTFLPRKNVVSIVGINGLNAPGILMHLDELEKPYVSGTGWKVNNSPADNTYKTKGYNDASWSGATVLSTGTITQTPSGATITGFPTTSTAKWIWSNSSSDKNVVLRYTFDIKAVGFGANTTGGDAGPVVVVTNVTDLLAQIASTTAKTILIKEGSYDLRDYRDQKTCRVECNSTLATYKGDFIDVGAGCPTNYRTVKRWEKLIWMSSNKSIIGMGRGASLRGASFYANGGNPQSNLIFRNLKIWDVNPHIIEANDGISLNAVTKLWVDHCSFKWISDGNDIADTKECTFSWNRWNGLNEYMCSGVDNYSAMITGYDITFDHQWWENSNGRAPKTYGTTNTRIHMINNYHSDNGYYASNSGSPSCLVYIENTHYEKVRFPTVKEHGGVIYCSGNKYDNIGSHSVDWVNSSEPKDVAAKFTIPYSYTLENVSTVKATCMSQSGTGGKWGTMPSYTETAGLSNTAPIVSITNPTTGTTFSNATPILISANASDAGGAISKVEFYSGTIKLGEDVSAPYSFNLTALTTCMYSLVAVAIDNNGNKTMSWPVIINVSSNPKKYIYNYDNSGNYAWSNTNSWTPKSIPTAIDTVIVRTGELQIANLDHKAPIYLEANGILRITNNSSVDKLQLQGGTLKVYTSNPQFDLQSNIVVEKPSTIMSGSVSATVFNLMGTITGSANLTKTSVGVLMINSDASGFKGKWIVEEGKLKIRSLKGMGACGVQVKANARLDIETASAASIYSLEIDSLGGVDLDADLNTEVAVFGSYNLSAGSFKNADYTTYIGGASTLKVSKSIVVLSGPSTFCAGNNVKFTATSSSSYSWKNMGSQVATVSSYTTSIAGSYNVELSNATGCKVSSAAVKTAIGSPITIIQNVKVDAGAWTAVPSATVCAGSTVNLGPWPTTAVGWSWTGPNNFTSSLRDPIFTNISAANAGTYTATFTDGSGCKATSTFNIQVSAVPTATITSPTKSICAGASVVLTASAGSSYKWFNGTTQVGMESTYTAAIAGSYTVEVSNASGCKASSAVTQVTVSTLPVATITTPITSFCSGESTVLTASIGSSYKWFNGTTQVGTTATYRADAAGSYSVEVSNEAGCKAISAVTKITVNTLPVATITTPITSFCSGESTVLTASIGSSYKWFNGTTQVGTTATYRADAAGSYTVEVSNEAGCKATSAVTKITINTLPTATITSPTTSICTGGSVVLTASIGSSYKWFNGTTQVGTAATYRADAAGSYSVEVSNQAGCKAISIVKQINVTTGTVWYQDIDGDGMGDLSVSQTSCTQPIGYVSTVGDACPTDANKTSAGNCGCGKTESSCLDCAGIPNGTAVYDNCNVCVGGTTSNTACVTTTTMNGTTTNITVVPQPFDNFTTIKLENLGMIQNVKVFTASGALVETFSNLHVEEISLGDNLAAGLYSVIIQTENGVYTTKIVKK